MKRVDYELETKDSRIEIRVSPRLLKAIKKKAKKLGIPYQRFIRMAVEKCL